MKTRRRITLGFVVVVCALVAAFFAWAVPSKRRAQSMSCASSICAICFCGRLYAEDYDGKFPTNFTSMRDHLMTSKILVCSADGTHKRAANWESYTDANSSYVIVTPGIHEADTNTVFIRCSIHGHLGYTDGTVFDGVRRRGKFE